MLLFMSVLQDDEKLYVPFPRKICIPSHCGCTSTYYRDITCVDGKGTCISIICLYMPYYYSFIYVLSGCFHCASVTFCACQSEATTLIHAGLFPATPKQPKLAFSFSLLDWFEALMLECQVSAQDFVAAVDVLTDSYTMKVPHMHLMYSCSNLFLHVQTRKCNLYPVIIDCFEEYR